MKTQAKYVRQVLFFSVFIFLFPFAIGVSLIRYIWAAFFDQDRAWVIATAYDRLGNSGVGGNGKKTISRSTGEAQTRGEKWACVLCRFLDWFDPEHCQKSLAD